MAPWVASGQENSLLKIPGKSETPRVAALDQECAAGAERERTKLVVPQAFYTNVKFLAGKAMPSRVI
jgi:hypothetical protein